MKSTAPRTFRAPHAPGLRVSALRATCLALALAACAGPSNDAQLVDLVGPYPDQRAPRLVQGPAGGVQPETSQLTSVLNSIQLADLRADLEWIAADERGGRDSPSEGLQATARYIAERLAQWGWEVPPTGSYLWTYSLYSMKLDTAATGLAVTGPNGTAELAFGQDYIFYSGDVWTGEVSGRLVWVGSADSEELTDIDLTGAIAVAFETEELSWRQRRAAVRDRGAVGLITTPAQDGSATEPYHEKYAGWVRGAERGRLAVTTESDGAGFPNLYLEADSLAQLLTLAGLETAPGVGTDLGLTARDRRAAVPEQAVQLENVVGVLPGTDPELSKEVILLSAHYDHVGVEGEEIFNGADDNGSGTTALLAVARALGWSGNLSRSVMIVWVSAEEKGLLGSEAFARNPALPEGMRAVANLNIDMVGRNAPEQLLITPTESHPEYNGLTEMIADRAALEGFTDLASADAYWSRSDHASFSEHMQIPVAFLFSDVHEDYHRATDTVDKIDFDKLRRATRLVVRMLYAMQGTDRSAETSWFAAEVTPATAGS